MTRVAAIDCGTNSLRLLVVDLDPATGRAAELQRRTTIVRLGQGVDRTGRFAPAALARTFETLDGYAAEVDRLGVQRIRFVATSAARDVANRQELTDGVVARVGVEPEVITGDEEAWLTYDGATRGLVGDPAFPEPLAVLDIGGGSTELVTSGDAGGPEIRGESMDVGSVRLTERHLHDDPPTARQVACVEADVEAALGRLALPLGDVRTLVGVAGTITTLAAMALGLGRYDRGRIHRARLSTADLFGCVDLIVRMSVAERKALPFMHPRRADVIAGGALVLGCVVRRLGLPELVASEHDILDGIAWSLATSPVEGAGSPVEPGRDQRVSRHEQAT